MLTIKSPAFQDMALIPVKYTCQGESVSPPLAFMNLPPKTNSLALICEDIDARIGIFDHWVMFNLPPSTTKIDEGTIPAGAVSGQNSGDKNGYYPPCPGNNVPHRYVFTLYALDAPLTLPEGASKDEVKQAMAGHILGQASLTGLYKRQ